MDEAGEDPQGGQSAHLLNLEADGAAVPDQPAEGGEIDDAPAEMTTLGETEVETTRRRGSSRRNHSVDETPADSTGNEASAESAQVGDEGATLLDDSSCPGRCNVEILRARGSMSEASRLRASPSKATSGR